MMEQPCIYHSELFRSFHLILNSILFHTIQVHKLFSFDNRKKKQQQYIYKQENLQYNNINPYVTFYDYIYKK